MSLAELKYRIVTVEAEVIAGDDSDEYRQCLIAGYEWDRQVKYLPKGTTEFVFESGLRSGRWVYEDWRTYHTREHTLAHPDDPHPQYWLEGRDKDLFYVEHPGVVFAVRPLPTGEYKMYYQVRGHKYIICDAYPESNRTRDEYVVQVTAPAGTLHEAFFDPVALGDAVGADGASGVLKPASFAVGGSDTTIKRIDWLNGQARMSLSPHTALSDHHIDFIALDGSVSLRLDFDDAVGVTADDGIRSLVWGVCSQAWQPGDLLMLRISQSPADLAGATFDADCAPPDTTPSPTATAAP